MTPNLIVHIGPMKTASSYLQNCLLDTADSLQTSGVHVPRGLADPQSPHVHHPVMRAVRNKERFGPMAEKFAALRADSHPQVVVTSEFLTALGRGGIRRFQQMIGPGPTTIVSMCRRWSDRFSSVWFNDIQTGGVQTMPDFVAALLADADQSREVDYSIVWQDWAHVFGRDALRIVPISAIGDQGGDVFASFCRDVLHIAEPPVPPRLGRRINPSGGAVEAELVRALNAISQERGLPKSTAMYFGYLTQRKTLPAQPVLDAIAAHQRPFVLDDDDPRLLGVYDRLAEYNRHLVCGTTMFTRRARTVQTVDAAYLALPGIRDRLADLHDMIAALPR